MQMLYSAGLGMVVPTIEVPVMFLFFFFFFPEVYNKSFEIIV